MESRSTADSLKVDKVTSATCGPCDGQQRTGFRFGLQTNSRIIPSHTEPAILAAAGRIECTKFPSLEGSI